MLNDASRQEYTDNISILPVEKALKELPTLLHNKWKNLSPKQTLSSEQVLKVIGAEDFYFWGTQGKTFVKRPKDD